MRLQVCSLVKVLKNAPQESMPLGGCFRSAFSSLGLVFKVIKVKNMFFRNCLV